MDKFIQIFERLGFWGFVLTFTVLAVIISESLIMIQSYWLTNSYIDKNLLIVGFITPAIGAFILFTFAGQILQKSRQQRLESEISKDAETELKQLFQQYINITDVMIVALDTKGTIRLANKMTCDVMGFDNQEALLGENWFKLYIPQENYENVYEAFQEIINGNIEAYKCYENTIRLKDGSTRLIAWNNEYIRSPNGQIIGTLSSGKDITAERAAQKQLEEQRNLLRTVIDQIPDPIMLKDARGKFLLANRSLATLYQTTPEAMIGKDNTDFMEDKRLARYYTKNVQAIMRRGVTETVYEDSQDAETGEYRHYRSIKKPFKNSKGEDEIVVIAQDITEEKQNLKDLYLLKHAIGHINDAYYLIAPDASFIETNRGAAKMLGYSIEELKTMSVFDINTVLSPEEWPDLIKELKEKDSLKIETFHRTKQGDLLNVEIVINHITFEGQEYILAIARDITKQKENLKDLYVMQHALSNIDDAYYLLDKHANLLRVNHAASKELGYSIEELETMTVGDVDHIYPIEQFSDFWTGIKQQKTARFESGHQRKDGSQFPVEVLSNFITYEGDEYVLSLARNISKQKEQQQKLDHSAKHDLLTDLPNRFMLNEILQSEMSRCERNQLSLAALYIDLDGFKEINDEYGHDEGDRVLKQVAHRMKQIVRNNDLVSRIGGDEFVVVLTDLKAKTEVLPMIQRLLHGLAQPLVTKPDSESKELEHRVTSSIGVSFYPQNEAIGSDALLRQADQAMYQSKTAGKNTYRMFDIDESEALLKQNQEIKEVLQAIHRDELVLHYQPKVEIDSGKIVGFEALVRWHSPEKGLLYPDAFLPVINDCKRSMLSLGEWVYKHAVSQLSEWNKQGHNFNISINVSSYEIRNKTIGKYLQTLLDKYPNVKPEQIELEILETHALEDSLSASRVINECRERGFKVSLDDFGTGYSTLSYLKNLPVNSLKIDRSFVMDMLHDNASFSIMEAAMGLAQAFRCTTVAEGVETLEQGVMLLKLGCNTAQGYAIAKPMPINQVDEWITNWKGIKQWQDVRPISIQFREILYAENRSRNWVKKIEESIELNDKKKLPSLDPNHCAFGRWLRTTAKDLFSDHELERVREPHQQLHKTAQQLKTSSSDQEAKQIVSELKQQQQALICALERLLLNCQ